MSYNKWVSPLERQYRRDDLTDQAASPVPSSETSGYGNLTGFDRALAETISRPRWLIYGATAVAVIIAWLWLSLMVSGVASADATSVLGPGMGWASEWLTGLSDHYGDNGLIAAFIKICTPQTSEGFNGALFLSVFSMWMMMSVAMMLPSAAPMLRTYGDIADVAVQKGEKIVPLFVLALGYLTIWALFSLGATLLQLALLSMGAVAGPTVPVQGIIAGLVLMLAGLYQFSSIKNACLEKCRNPFSVLFGRWTNQPFGVFKIGLEQGLFCVGCCWALMLVMLVVGTMNLAWMAFFTLFTVLEKSGRGKLVSTVSGVIFLIWGSVLTTLSLIAG